MEYTIITPIEMTTAAAAAASRSSSDISWQLAVIIIVAAVAISVIATSKYYEGQSLQKQASPTVA